MHARALPFTHYTGKVSVRPISVGMVLLLVCAGCGLESPEAPGWSVDVQIPLAARNFDIPYIVDRIDIDELQWSEDQGVSFHIERLLDSVFVDDNLRVDAVTTQVDLPLERVRIAVGAATVRTLGFDDLYSGPLGLITAFSSGTRQSLAPLSEFSTADVIEGTLNVMVINNLGLTLDSVMVSLFDAGAATPFVSVPIDETIPTGVTKSSTVPLPSLTIGSEWDVELAFHTPGGTVLTASDKSVTVIVALPDGVQIASGSGVVSSFDYESHELVSISSEHAIYQAQIATGEVVIEWENQTPVPLTVDWHSGDITNGSGPLGGQFTLAAFTHNQQVIVLDGYTAELAAHQSRVQIDATVSSPGSDGAIVGIDASAGVIIDTEFRDIVLASGTLALAPTTMDLPSVQTAIDWPNGLESIGLAEGTATLEITSSLPWPADISGQVSVPGGESISFDGVVDASTVSTIDIGSVDHLLNPLPGTLDVSGVARYGDGTTTASVSASDYIVARVIVNAPANLLLDSASVHGDPEPVTLADDEDGDLDGRFLGGAITVDVSNHLPIGTEILISIASDSLRLEKNPDLILGPSSIAAATTNASGEAIDASHSRLSFVLSQDDVRLFERDSIWVTENLILHGPGPGVPARILSSDYVDWTATAVLNARMGDRDNAEGTR